MLKQLAKISENYVIHVKNLSHEKQYQIFHDLGIRFQRWYLLKIRMGTDHSPLTCGANFNLTQALHCAKGAYTHIGHNEIRDTFANLMTLKLSRNFSRGKAKALSTIQLQLKMRHDLTLRQTDSGVYDLAALSFL